MSIPKHRQITPNEVYQEIEKLKASQRFISSCLGYLGAHKRDFPAHEQSEMGEDRHLAIRQFGKSAATMHALLQELGIAARLYDVFQLNEEVSKTDEE